MEQQRRKQALAFALAGALTLGGITACGDDANDNNINDGVEEDVGDLSDDLSEGIDDASDEIEDQVDEGSEEDNESNSGG